MLRALLLALLHERCDLGAPGGGGGERRGVLERSLHRFAGADGFCRGGVSPGVDVLRERGEVVDAVLELAHERERLLAHLVEGQLRGLGREAVQRELEDWLAVVYPYGGRRSAGRRARRPGRPGFRCACTARAGGSRR